MSHRQWYAMKSRLKKAGKWQEATHKVAQQEEGEPDPKIPRPNDDGGDTDPEMPPLESPEAPSSQGNYFYFSG